MDLVARPLVEPVLYPSPHGSEVARRVHDGDGVQRLGVVGGGHGAGLLQVAPEGPQRADGAVGEVDDGVDGHDGDGRVAGMREVRAERRGEAGHEFPQRGDPLAPALLRNCLQLLEDGPAEGRQAVDVYRYALLVPPTGPPGIEALGGLELLWVEVGVEVLDVVFLSPGLGVGELLLRFLDVELARAKEAQEDSVVVRWGCRLVARLVEACTAEVLLESLQVRFLVGREMAGVACEDVVARVRGAHCGGLYDSLDTRGMLGIAVVLNKEGRVLCGEATDV